MTPGDLVIYCGCEGDPRPAVLVRFLSDRKALIRLAGVERRVWVSSLQAIGGAT